MHNRNVSLRILQNDLTRRRIERVGPCYSKHTNRSLRVNATLEEIDVRPITYECDIGGNLRFFIRQSNRLVLLRQIAYGCPAFDDYCFTPTKVDFVAAYPALPSAYLMASRWCSSSHKSLTMAWREHTAFLLLITLFFPSIFSLSNCAVAANRKLMAQPAIKAGYWPTWTISYSPPSSVQFSYFTHVFYAFVQVDSATFGLAITADDDSMLRNFTAAIHANPPVKSLLSIGGGDSNSAFAALAADPASRSAFINSTITAAREYGLDGLDLDWEFPKDAKEMADFSALLLEWRAAVVSEAAATGRPRLLLTAAVYFAPRFFLSDDQRSYPIEQMATALDWINAMCYDFHGSWDTTATGEHAALYDPSSNISTSYGLESWVDAGMPKSKVAMGMPLYGRTWKLKDPSQNGIGAPAVGVGPGEDGVLVYSQVVEFNRNNSATVVHDEVTTAAYSYAGTSWIGYDDPWSVTRKINYAQRLGLGGYFFWAIGYDKDWSISGTGK
ncbi:hypothetical protein BHE74_00032196 [Ensete ventricosum]|nr:hypothetical protein BHE74_00032196 [Ensete ventricosum]